MKRKPITAVVARIKTTKSTKSQKRRKLSGPSRLSLTCLSNSPKVPTIFLMSPFFLACTITTKTAKFSDGGFCFFKLKKKNCCEVAPLFHKFSLSKMGNWSKIRHKKGHEKQSLRNSPAIKRGLQQLTNYYWQKMIRWQTEMEKKSCFFTMSPPFVLDSISDGMLLDRL